MGEKIYIEADGCNRRLLEMGKIRNYLETNDYECVDSPNKAEYILLATCAFKKNEEEHSISRLRVLKKFEAELMIYGCLPDISPEKFQEFAGIRHIAPKNLERIDDFFNDIKVKYADIPESNLIESHRQKPVLNALKTKVKTGEIFKKEFYGRTKRFLKQRLTNNKNESKNFYLYICRGCLGKCSYCAIRRAVGTVKSKNISEIVEEFNGGYQYGYRNFIILGDDPGCYGIDKNTTFHELLSALLEKSEALAKDLNKNRDSDNNTGFYINEIHPKFLIMYENELIKLMSKSRLKGILCPIQSGNNRILKLMNREHTAEELKGVINKIKELNPDIQLSTQIITGFPSETDAEFFQTINFLKDTEFNTVTVFPYHDKINTPASKLDKKIPEKEIQKRAKMAVEFLDRSGIEAYTKCLV